MPNLFSWSLGGIHASPTSGPSNCGERGDHVVSLSPLLIQDVDAFGIKVVQFISRCTPSHHFESEIRAVVTRRLTVKGECREDDQAAIYCVRSG